MRLRQVWRLRRARLALGAAAAALLALGVAAGSLAERDGARPRSAEGARPGPGVLTVYSSLPLHGPDRGPGKAIVEGIELARTQRGGRAGGYAVRHVPLDDSTRAGGRWDLAATSANARRALLDESTIAYIGEFDSAASAVSIPILNESRVPQIGPAGTAVGLTGSAPGARSYEPAIYYPTGERTFVRLAPRDKVQAAALATAMKEEGCRRVYVLNDARTAAAGLSRSMVRSLRKLDVKVLANHAVDRTAPGYRHWIPKMRPDCVAYSGMATHRPVRRLMGDLAAAMPRAKLFGTTSVADPRFYSERHGGLSPDAASRLRFTMVPLAPQAYPPEGRRFFDAFAAEYGKPGPSTYAIYGYEAMSLALDAIERAGQRGGDRKAVLEAIFRTRDRRSVLGRYRIDRQGDISTRRLGLYKVVDGRLVFERAVDAKGR